MARERGGDRREVAVLATCLILSVGMFVFSKGQSGRVLTRIELAMLWPADAARSFVEGILVDRRENENLKREIALLRREQLRLLQKQSGEIGARRARRFSQQQIDALLPARVLASSGEPWPLVYHLSVGAADGIAVGQPVISPEGLVGRIVAVDPRTSSASLITDPLLAVSGEIVPGGARGVLRFRLAGRPGLYLDHVPLTDTVRVGDDIVSSGMSRGYPAGIPIGIVTRVGRDPGGLVQEIEVAPSAPLSRLREVFAVVAAGRLRSWAEESERR